jgi:hypothetical protein
MKSVSNYNSLVCHDTLFTNFLLTARLYTVCGEKVATRTDRIVVRQFIFQANNATQ